VAVQDDAEFVAMAEVLEYRGRRWRNGRGPLTDRLRQSRANWRIIALRDGSASARSLTSGEGGRISSPHGKLMRRQPRSRTWSSWSWSSPTPISRPVWQRWATRRWRSRWLRWGFSTS